MMAKVRNTPSPSGGKTPDKASNVSPKGRKFSKSAGSKTPGGRYFNSPLNSNVGGGSGKDNKFKGKKGQPFKRNNNSATPLRAGGVGAAPPPKPKRLNKSPFKVTNNDSDSKSFKKGDKRNNRQSKGPNEGQKMGKKQGGTPDDGGSQETLPTPTPETKERIKKIRNNTRQKEKNEVHKVIIKPGGEKWFDMENLNPKNSGTSPPEKSQSGGANISKENLRPIYNSASKLFDKDVFAYRQACLQGKQKSDFQWMDKMLKVGTLPDKMAAYVVRIQDSPIHNLQHLQNLIGMVKVQSKQQCLMAADTLKDLFLEDLLPPDRKLVTFEKQGNNVIHAKESQLIICYFEDRLKACYISFINALKQMSLDNVEKIRAKAVSLIYVLLSSHPEQESALLQMLVNKLGDTLKKVASRALFYLNTLLNAHPRMKLVVIDEVERLLFRNNIAKRAQYYGVCFLNSINLNNEHPEVACKLINVYVAFFKGCIKTGDIDSKMMSALLTGVNKSYPLAKEYGYKFTENTDTLYKIAHLSNFNISIQALSILFQLTDVDTRPNDADRYYRVLYRELLRPEMATTSHNVQFLNLIFKSMKCDNRINRVIGFTKRLLMICQSAQPNLACAILFLLSEVAKVHSGIILCGASKPTEDNEENSDASDDELGNDTSQTDEGILNLMKISNVKVIKDKEDVIIGKARNVQVQYGTANSPASKLSEVQEISGTENENMDDSVVQINEIKREYKQEITEYDPHARNPCYCGAEFSLAHEVATLAKHFHPSVALFAEALLRKESIAYEGNPLKDFTVSRFLERFVYRNMKKPKTIPGGRTLYQPTGLRSIAVNSADYLKNDEEDIPAEERFFYRYFKAIKTTDDNADVDSDTESVGDDEFDALMANYFKSRKGKDEEDDEDETEDVDFASNINTTKQSKKKKSQDMDEESDDDEPMEDDISDEEFEDTFEDDDADEMIDMDDDGDEMIDMDEDDDLDFQDEDGLEVFEEDFDEPVKSKKMRKLTKDMDMFAPAEQFSEMLEANADESISGPSQLISRDRAGPKQLKWEMDRERWAKGYKRNLKSTFKGKNKGRQGKRTK